LTSSSDIWLAELVRAADKLQPKTAEIEQKLAALLGFAPAAGRRRGAGEPASPAREAGPSDGGGGPPAPTPPPKTGADRREQVPSAASPALLQPVRVEHPGGSERWRAVDALPPPPEASRTPRLRLQPLFQPRWRRELLVAVAAQQLPYGLVDADRAVQRAARAQPLFHIPRLPRWSVSRGLQVLVDLGPGTEPFRRDQQELVAALKTILGSGVSVLFLWGSPARRVSSEERGDLVYRRPAPGAPVLLLGDLGFAHGETSGSAAPEREWVAFADSLRRQGSRLAALVTRNPKHFPRAVARAVALVPWRIETTQRTVREALGRS
jgi:hypothetical protein